MKSKVKVSDLSDALGFISPAISAKSTSKVHTHALFALMEGKMYITGNNGNIEMNTVIPAENSGSFTLTVDFAKLFAMVKTYPSDAFITLTFKDNKCKTKCQRATGTVFTLNANEYPKFDVEEQTKITIDNKLLSSAINRVAIAADKDNVRAYFNSVCLNFIPQKGIDVIASDGKKVHKVHIESDEVQEAEQILLPIKTIGYLKSVLESTEKTDITYSENLITIQSGNRRVVSNVLASKYPDINRAIPDHPLHTIEVDSETLKKSLVIILAIAENVIASKTKVVVTKNSLSISTKNTLDATEASDSIPVDFSGDTDIEFGLAPKQLKDAITMAGSETITIGICDSDGKIKIQNEDFTAMVAGVRL